MHINTVSHSSSAIVSRKMLGSIAAGGAVVGFGFLFYYAIFKNKSNEPAKNFKDRKFIIITDLENTAALEKLAACNGDKLLFVGVSSEQAKNKSATRKILNQQGLDFVPVVQGLKSAEKKTNKLQKTLKQVLEEADFNSIRIALSASGKDLAKVLYDSPHLQEKIQHIDVMAECFKGKDAAACALLMRMTNISMTLYLKMPHEAADLNLRKNVRLDIDWKNSTEKACKITIHNDSTSKIAIAEESSQIV